MRSTRGYIKERFSGVFIQRLGLRSSPISPVDIKRRTFTKGNYKKNITPEKSRILVPTLHST